MEVVVAVPHPPSPSATGLTSENNSACSSPYITAPSSPQRFPNFFFSAPTSPSRIPPSFSHHQDHHQQSNNRHDEDGDDAFEFNFSAQLDRASLSADELFDGGKIRPLKPASTSVSPPSLSSSSSSRSRSIQKRDLDESSKLQTDDQVKEAQPRGRERISSSDSNNSSILSSSRKGISRSLSPLRVSDVISEQDDRSPTHTAKIISSNAGDNQNRSYASSILNAISFSKGYRKWKLKDLLLFRSASEGRPTIVDDSLRNTKYAVLSKKEAEEVRNSSFRSTESSGSVRRRGPVSAHELHYTANRAVAEEMKRKTLLPYKQGLLGCLGFNHGMHDISRGVGSMTRV